MSDVNFVAMSGNLCGDPRVRAIGEDRLVASFMLASNKYWQGEGGEKKSRACFVEVSCFGKLAEKVRDYALKGTRVWVEGYLKLDQWNDKQSGDKRSKVSITSDNLLIMSGRGTGKRAREQRAANRARQNDHGVPDGPQPPPEDDFDDDNIPEV